MRSTCSSVAYASADPLRNAYLRRLIILYLDSLGSRRTYNLTGRRVGEGGGRRDPAFCLFSNVNNIVKSSLRLDFLFFSQGIHKDRRIIDLLRALVRVVLLGILGRCILFA